MYNINGRLVYKNVSSKLIDWDGKSRSKIQFKTKQFLKEFWSRHICYEEFPVYGTKMSVDILNATKKIAVEVQGQQHENYNRFFHKNRLNYFYSIQRDHNKRVWLEKNDYVLAEVNHDEISKLSEGFFADKFGISLL